MLETKTVYGKDGPNVSVLKVTVTLLLRSMYDVVTEAMTAIGAYVNLFVGR
jgi:hypothetical protein